MMTQRKFPKMFAINNTIRDEQLDALLSEIRSQQETAAEDEIRLRRLVSGVMARDAHTAPLPPPQKEKGRVFIIALWSAGVVAATAALLTILNMVWASPQNSWQAAPLSTIGWQLAPPGVTQLRVNILKTVRQWEAKGSAAGGARNLRLPAGVEVAVAQGASVSVKKAAAHSVALDLTAGTLWISKDPSAKTSPLTLSTPHAAIKVVGTSLSVTVRSTQTEVMVLEGKIRVTDLSQTIHVLKAGRVLTTTGKHTETGAVVSLKKEQALFEKLGLKLQHNTPVQTARTDNAARLQKKPGADSRKEQKTELYSRIELHRQNREWQSVAGVYMEIISRYGTGPEGQSAQVALGNLYMENLHEPVKALAWYNQYLQSEGRALRPEALLGKARALSALGREDAEKAILQQLIAAYPQTPYAATAEQRLGHEER